MGRCWWYTDEYDLLVKFMIVSLRGVQEGWKGLRGNQNISLTGTTEAEAAATEQRRLINLQMGIMGLKSSWMDGWVRCGGLWGV